MVSTRVSTASPKAARVPLGRTTKAASTAAAAPRAVSSMRSTRTATLNWPISP